MSSILRDNQELVTDGLGTNKSHKVTLSVAAIATPRFHLPRSMPYALKPAVEAVGQALEVRLLERVDFYEWAAKKDGKVGMCGDYEVTVNPS